MRLCLFISFQFFGTSNVSHQLVALRIHVVYMIQVNIALDPGLRITLWFTTEDEKWNFIGFLNLPENQSSSDETGRSGSRSNPSTGPSSDSGIVN
jgi:hypothetical protein